MGTKKSARPRCQVSLEGWRPDVAAAIWADPSPDALRVGIEALADLLTNLVDRPSDVTLVLPVDIRQAIMRRSPGAPYNVERGSGIVGGRTMLRNDGGVDVIVDGNFLVASDASGMKFTSAGGPRVSSEAVQLLRRTVAHEAQHAVMDMRGSGFDNYGFQSSWGTARRYQFAVAVKMCDEHRAQWNAAAAIGRNPPTVGDVLDFLCHMGQELATAAARFQESSHAPADIGRLREDVYTAVIPVWTMAAYWTAEYRDGNEISEMPQEITQLKIWQRYIGASWELLTEALSQLPVLVDTSPEVLHQGAKRVAAAVAGSLEHIGFRHYDSPTLVEFFYIDRYDFPSARE
jgi:hypothetical protein